VIERRTYFVPKNKSDRTLEVDAELLAALDESRGLPDAWMIPAPHDKARYDSCHNDINDFLRPLLPVKTNKWGKGAYRLRKEAGSRIADRLESEGGGIQAAADFLGDSVATTEKFYRGRRRTVRGVSSVELANAA
jgi:integrase